VKDVAIAPISAPGSDDQAFVAFVCGTHTDDFESRLEAHAHRELAPHERPLRVFHIHRLPTTTNGKVDRKRLIQLAEQRLQTFEAGCATGQSVVV